MDLSKLSTALAPANLADTADVTISPTFTLKVCQMVNYNQAYKLKTAEFAKKFSDHPYITDTEKFLNQWNSGEKNKHTVAFMAHVIMCGWSLKDDDGNDVEFSPQNAIQLLQTPIGSNIFGKLVNIVRTESVFQIEWTEDAVKN
jgi:hypothetical protein